MKWETCLPDLGDHITQSVSGDQRQPYQNDYRLALSYRQTRVQRSNLSTPSQLLFEWCSYWDMLRQICNVVSISASLKIH